MNMIEIGQAGRGLAAVVTAAGFWFSLWAPSGGCEGSFARDSDGYLPGETGLMPARARRAAGETARFVSWETDGRRRYLATPDALFYPERDVKLVRACRLPRDPGF